MLGGVAFALLELRKVLDDSLHVLDSLELSLALLLVKEPLHHIVNSVGHFAEVVEHQVFEELIVVTGQNDLFHLL